MELMELENKESKSTSGFQETEVGVIPVDWFVIQLSELGNFSKGQGIRKDESNSGELPCVRYGEIYTRHNNYIKQFFSFISKEVATTSKKLRKGDLLFAGSGETKEDIGKCVAFLGEMEAYAGGDIVLLSIKNHNPLFLGFLLNSPFIVKQKASRGQGDAVVHISANQLKNISIPIPPTLSEQTAIATALSEADALISSLEQLIAKKKLIKQGAMQELLRVREGWELKKLTDVVNYIHGKAHEKDIIEDGKYIVVNSKFVSSEGEVKKYSNTNYCPAKRNDILTVLSDLPNGKALAKCFFVTADKIYAVNQRVCIWRTKGVDPLFLYYILNRYKYFLSIDDGVSQTHILNKHIQQCEISIPKDESMQKRIGIILRDMDNELDRLIFQLDKCRKIKQGMMQDLLTGRVRLI